MPQRLPMPLPPEPEGPRGPRGGQGGSSGEADGASSPRAARPLRVWTLQYATPEGDIELEAWITGDLAKRRRRELRAQGRIVGRATLHPRYVRDEGWLT